jgi:hypothetical protein
MVFPPVTKQCYEDSSKTSYSPDLQKVCDCVKCWICRGVGNCVNDNHDLWINRQTGGGQQAGNPAGQQTGNPGW